MGGPGCGPLERALCGARGPPRMDAGSPHLGHVLQQADVDGDQAREALVGEAQAFHEEQQLRRAAGVLDHVVELLLAQDVDVTLAEERIWREGGRCQTLGPRGEVPGAGSPRGDKMAE